MLALPRRSSFLSRRQETEWQSTLVARGKKRIKRKPPPCKPMILEEQESVEEYLEYGRALGLSAEEVIKRARAKAETGAITLDAAAEETIQKFRQKAERRIKEDQEMKRFLKEGMDWEKMKESMSKEEGGYEPKVVPTWATAKKYIRQQVDPADLLAKMKEKFNSDQGSDYGRRLLTDDEDLPDDFSYQDLEKMIEQLPENLIPDGKWHDEEPEEEKAFFEGEVQSEPVESNERKVPPLAPRPTVYGLHPALPETETQPDQKQPDGEMQGEKKRAIPPLRRPGIHTDSFAQEKDVGGEEIETDAELEMKEGQQKDREVVKNRRRSPTLQKLRRPKATPPRTGDPSSAVASKPPTEGVDGTPKKTPKLTQKPQRP